MRVLHWVAFGTVFNSKNPLGRVWPLIIRRAGCASSHKVQGLICHSKALLVFTLKGYLRIQGPLAIE